MDVEKQLLHRASRDQSIFRKKCGRVPLDCIWRAVEFWLEHLNVKNIEYIKCTIDACM